MDMGFLQAFVDSSRVYIILTYVASLFSTVVGTSGGVETRLTKPTSRGAVSPSIDKRERDWQRNYSVRVSPYVTKM